MAENKKGSQFSILDGNSITSATRFDIIDALTNYTLLYGDLSGTEGNRGLLYKIQQDLFASYTQVDYAADIEDYLNLGLASAYRYVEIEYVMERGTKYRGGKICVIHNGSTAFANDSYMPAQEDNSYCVIAGSVDVSSQIQIKITTDNSDFNDTKFKYRILKQIPVAE